MEEKYKQAVIDLFNTGKLTMMSAEWYKRHGINVICADGKVVDIVEDENWLYL